MKSPVVPAPWRLYGHGYVIVLAPGTRRQRGQGEPPGVRRCGGFGVVMAMDYRRSDVGAYRELLYIPGRLAVRTAQRDSTAIRTVRGYSISRIYVTSEASRKNGFDNWGIPKELGRITSAAADDFTGSILVAEASGRPLVEISRRESRLSRLFSCCTLPVSDWFLPHTLIQVLANAVYRTSIRARGRVRLAGRVTVRSYAPQTAEMAGRRVLLAFHIPRISLRFPAAARLARAAPTVE